MKTIIRFLLQAVCLLLMAAGLAGAILASFFVSAMVIVWFQEGALQITDRKMLGEGAKWLLGSSVLVGVAGWLRGKIAGNKPHDGSFRLVEVKSGQSEKVLQNVSDLILLVLLVIWLWPHIPGTALGKIPMVLGWVTIGFLGMHARIALHEIGHLIAAWLLDLDLRKIQVGVGPLLWSRSFANGLLSEWRAWPQFGYMVATHRNTVGFRARQFLVVVAGPLADLVILWLAYQLITHSFGSLGAAFAQGACGVVLSALFWWTAFSAVASLVPHKRWMNHRKVWTDGYWLLRLAIGADAQIAELARDSNWRELLDLLKFDGPQSRMIPDAIGGELPTHLAGPGAFHEQRVLLSSRLLRKPPFTSSPPA